MTTIVVILAAVFALGFATGAESALAIRDRNDRLDLQQLARHADAAEAFAEAETTLLEDLYQQPAYGDE